MIDFLINDTAIAHNSSFEMREDMRWISPREFKYGWSGQMIYQNASTLNHMELNLTLDGWVTAPILSSLTLGSIVTVGPTVPISYKGDDFTPTTGTVLREVDVYNPGLVKMHTLTMEVRGGVAALASDHQLMYGNNKPELEYTYKLTYIKFLAVVVENIMTTSRNGASHKITFRSVNPITEKKPTQPI